MLEHMTHLGSVPSTVDLATERRLLADPGTHRLVHQCLALTEGMDPVDVVNDIAIVHGVVLGRLERHQGQLKGEVG